jgi:hypothetical protein
MVQGMVTRTGGQDRLVIDKNDPEVKATKALRTEKRR